MLTLSYTWVSKNRSIFEFAKTIGNFSKKNYRNMYRTIEKGSLYTDSYRIYIENDAGPLSPFHDIPAFADTSRKTCNMVVEIPRWTNAKMEINLKTALNPIKQDIKGGKPRFVANCFPHHGYIWNYGAIPQTWENPNINDEHTSCKGDNDPIDILEIGYRVAKRGEVLQVKVLGCIALIDEGETDWKIISINVDDPISSQVNDLQDVDKFFPGLLKASVEWFKIYKIPDGKPENQFAFNGEAKNRDFALKIIEEVHKQWQNLLKSPNPPSNMCLSNTTQEGPHKISVSEAKNIVEQAVPLGEPAAIDQKNTDKWHFCKLQREL